jgi:hypothetical protein
LQLAVALQVTAHAPSHLMSQLEESAQVMLLPAPRCSLQLASWQQAADEAWPAFSSHFAEASQTMLLPSPP